MPHKIIIIGASSGIGKELALIYAGRGHTVAITARRNELLQEIRKAYPDNIHAYCFDVTGKINHQALQGIINDLGGADLLVYNAGFGDAHRELDWPTEQQTTLTNVC